MTWGGSFYFDEDGNPVNPERTVQEELEILMEISGAVSSADTDGIAGKKEKKFKPRFINGGRANRWRGLGYRGRR